MFLTHNLAYTPRRFLVILSLAIIRFLRPALLLTSARYRRVYTLPGAQAQPNLDYLRPEDPTSLLFLLATVGQPRE